ncbi:MAG: hypothetical protein J6J23_07580, partial [Clostridia bacterium]|nr:hypothetical protein [Clostridia bacterium]
MLVSTDVAYFSQYNDNYPQTKLDPSKEILIEARFADKASASIVDDGGADGSGFTVIQIVDPTPEVLGQTFEDADTMAKTLLTQFGQYQSEISATFNGKKITTPSGFFNLVDLAGTTAKLYATSTGELKATAIYAYDDEANTLSSTLVGAMRREGTSRYVDIEFANFAGETVVIVYESVDTSDIGLNFTFMQTANGKIQNTTSTGTIKAKTTLTPVNGKLNVSTQYADNFDGNTYELLKSSAEISSSTSTVEFKLTGTTENFVGWYLNGKFVSSNTTCKIDKIINGSIVEARYYSSARKFNFESLIDSGSTSAHQNTNLVALTANAYNQGKVPTNSNSGTGVATTPYYIYSSTTGYIQNIESYGENTIRLYAPSTLYDGTYLLKGFFYTTKGSSILTPLEDKRLETGSSKTGELLIPSNALPETVENVYAIYGKASSLTVMVNTDGSLGVLPEGIMGVSHGLNITTEAVQKTYTFSMTVKQTFGYSITEIGYSADGADEIKYPVKTFSNSGSITYSANIALTGDTNVVTFYAKNSKTREVSIYTSHFDTVITTPYKTQISGSTTLNAEPTSIYNYEIDGASYQQTLKFVGWYLLDLSTGKTTLACYDKTLSLNALDDQLDRYALVKKYDGTGNNNLVPTQNVLSLSIDGTKFTAEDISGNAEDTYETLGITLQTEDTTCIVSADTFLNSEIGANYSFVGWYRNGLLLGKNASLAYDITKGTAQNVEARFTSNIIDLSISVYSYNADSDDYEQIPDDEFVSSILTTTNICNNGKVDPTKDALLSISLPIGQIIDISKTREANIYIDLLVSGNNIDARSASLIIPKLSIDGLIQTIKQAQADGADESTIKDLKNVKIYLSESLYDGHETLEQVFGEDLGAGSVEVERTFSIDEENDLTIKIKSYLVKVQVNNSPDPVERADGYTINTHYF